MADPSGFLKFSRQGPARRPIPLRLRDWNEVYEPIDSQDVRIQATRCMDCGIPFCHQGCPLGNIIPEWNELVRTDKWEEASDRLHATNNFPEFTGRLCPAPCEGACVLGIGDEPVAIKLVEQQIADHAITAGFGLTPRPAELSTGRSVAVVGSGPAGLAAAQQLARAGHAVTVYERDARIGGLMRYGIPEFKMERAVLDRRLEQMTAEGVTFVADCAVGVDLTVEQLQGDYDAVVLATGSTIPRELTVDGRHLDGVHLAMPYLIQQNQVLEGTRDAVEVSAEGKKVIIIGGGDTGADCYGTALAAERGVGHPAGHPRRAADHPSCVHSVADVPAVAADHLSARRGRRARLRRQLDVHRGHRRQGDRPAHDRGQADPRWLHSHRGHRNPLRRRPDPDRPRLRRTRKGQACSTVSVWRSPAAAPSCGTRTT